MLTEYSKLPPSKRNQILLEEMKSNMPDDYMAICVFVTPDYEKYLLVWDYCVKLAYPQYERVIIPMSGDGDKAAAARFIEGEKELSKYPYVLITDVDILITREPRSILFQHLFHMKREGLVHYSNMMTDDYRMSGCHFLCQSWWDVTRKARDKYREELKTMQSAWGIDEPILAKIVLESGLPMVKGVCLWAIHGMHMGALKRVKEIDINEDLLNVLAKKEGIPEYKNFANLKEFFNCLIEHNNPNITFEMKKGYVQMLTKS